MNSWFLLEDFNRQPEISKSVQRFQLSIKAKVKLDFAISPGTWLMSSNMVLNTENKVGFKNLLKLASPTMKYRCKLRCKYRIRPVGIKHNFGNRKVKLLSGHKESKSKQPVMFQKKRQQ